MDAILKNCKLFEVNSGAMYRLGKPEPYPSMFLIKELFKRGGEVIITSDSHDADSICHKFGEIRELLKTCGFKYSKRLTKSGFIDVAL
jgi:histidinol-phosphatase (PHP family)